jgi:hypothetical protein
MLTLTKTLTAGGFNFMAEDKSGIRFMRKISKKLYTKNNTEDIN